MPNNKNTDSSEEEKLARKLGFLSPFQMRSYEASLKEAERLQKHPVSRERALEQVRWIEEQRKINRQKELKNLKD